MIAQQEIEGLSPDERLVLIERLWDSLSDDEAPLPDAQRRELERRLQAFGQEKVKSVPWDEIKADLDARKR